LDPPILSFPQRGRDTDRESFPKRGGENFLTYPPKLNAESKLSYLYKTKNYAEFIKLAISLRKNIVISGGTSSGKTTYLNACIKYIPKDQRLILLEDTRELKISHDNYVSLLASKGEQSRANITMQDLVQCALRLRPDRIIMGEIRGKEIMDFVSACSTGHDGSLTSIHANSPTGAFMRMVQLYKLNCVPSMRDDEILSQLKSVIDIVIQLNKTPRGRCVGGVYFKGL
jgi:type IV secretion system protein VirB11